MTTCRLALALLVPALALSSLSPAHAATNPAPIGPASAAALPTLADASATAEDERYAVSHLGIDYTVSSNEYLGTVRGCYEACFDVAQDAAAGHEWARFMASLGLLPDFLQCAFGYTDDLTFGACMADLFYEAWLMGITYSEAPGFEELYDCLDACDAEHGDLDGCTGGGCEGADEPEEDDECNTDYDCGETMYCSQVRMTCQPTVGLGQACLRDDVCDSGCCEYDSADSWLVTTCQPQSTCQ